MTRKQTENGESVAVLEVSTNADSCLQNVSFTGTYGTGLSKLMCGTGEAVNYVVSKSFVLGLAITSQLLMVVKAAYEIQNRMTDCCR